VGAVSTAGRDYKVELWLEGSDGQVISHQVAQGRMFTLTAKIPDLTSSVLEAGSSKEAVTRDRLAKTAVSYERAGRPKDAARTYGRAVAINPFHADAARLSIKIVHVWERAGDVEQAQGALETLLASYGPQSPWGQAGLGGPEVQEEVGRAVSAFLVREGNRQHEAANALADDKAQAAERQAALVRAFDAYDRALKLYPDGKVDSGEVAFHLAEVAFELGRFDAAIGGYTLASTQGPTPRQQEASVGLCFALEGKLAKSGIYDANKSHKVPASAQRLPNLLTRYLAATDALAERFATSKEATVFSYRAAQAELAFGHKNAGKARLQKAIALGTDEDSVKRARRLLGKL
jgi:tetratricopeptide (TPR) repeat protein